MTTIPPVFRGVRKKNETTGNFFYEVFLNNKTHQLTFDYKGLGKSIDDKIGVFESLKEIPLDKRMIYLYMREQMEDTYKGKFLYDKGKKPDDGIGACLGF